MSIADFPLKVDQYSADVYKRQVHYHDSICAYESQANNMIDVYAQYDKVLDLKKLVEVCTTAVSYTHLDVYKRQE